MRRREEKGKEHAGGGGGEEELKKEEDEKQMPLYFDSNENATERKKRYFIWAQLKVERCHQYQSSGETGQSILITIRV